MQPRLVQSLRSLAGPLAPRRLGFVEGGLGEPTVAAPDAPAPPPATLSEELRDQAAVIQDEGIRAAFLETAGLYLGRVAASRGTNNREDQDA